MMLADDNEPEQQQGFIKSRKRGGKKAEKTDSKTPTQIKKGSTESSSLQLMQ